MCYNKHAELFSSGFDHVDLEAAKELGMKVMRVPEYSPYAGNNTKRNEAKWNEWKTKWNNTFSFLCTFFESSFSSFPVAEHAAALVLTLNRKTHKAYNRVREQNFSLDGLMGMDLNGNSFSWTFFSSSFSCPFFSRSLFLSPSLLSLSCLLFARRSPLSSLFSPHLSSVALPSPVLCHPSFVIFFLIFLLIFFRHITGKTVGIVGTGKIGAIFARIMTGFGCNLVCLYFRRCCYIIIVIIIITYYICTSTNVCRIIVWKLIPVMGFLTYELFCN